MPKALWMIPCATVLTLLSIPSGVWGQDRLDQSPRHQEWVTIQQGRRQIQAFVVFPEVSEAALAVVVIHENRGLNEWVRSVADRLAEAGYIAIAPDLLSGMGPDGGGTRAFPSADEARQALYQLPPEQVKTDLDAAVDYVTALPAANGKAAVAGFCWGGSQTFRFATQRLDLAAAFVFYGRAPEDEVALARIACPVYGFYGGDDQRINATLPRTEAAMQAAKKTYEPVIYPGARHAFMRAGQTPDGTPANKEARGQAWVRWLRLLGKY